MIPRIHLLPTWSWFLIATALTVGAPAMGQLPTSEERLKILTDPESLKSEAGKRNTKPPIEFFRSQVAPFDILPYIKANHWSTINLEMRVNYEDYSGILRSSPARLLAVPSDGRELIKAPHEVVYLRDARLIKEQRSKPGMQILLPEIPKEGINLELLHPEGIRVDELWQASLRKLDPHQMLVLILSKDSTDLYARWNTFQSLVPHAANRYDPIELELQRYYRLVLPLDSEHLPLSSHPLTWSTLSHVIWDGLPPERLQPAQQRAMVDWLHWGGQLIVVGGAQPSFSALRESFLGSYLPADPSGENVLLNEKSLAPLASAYPPPTPVDAFVEAEPVPKNRRSNEHYGSRYLAGELIHPASNRPVFLAGLTPREGASVIPLGKPGGKLLGVERRVGRGRILMLGVNLADPAFLAWPGLDTFVRRVVLRRPEEPKFQPDENSPLPPDQRTIGFLSARDLSWFRYAGRDAATVAPAMVARSDESEPDGRRYRSASAVADGEPIATAAPPVAEWADWSGLPRQSREALELASGISIPRASFVLKVILAYVIALVPLNWLVCRYVFGRRELAWVVVPILAFGFAFAVERAAAYDTGYDTAGDEINVLETYADYPRGHLSRFASLYTTGRVRFTVSYPNDPTAVALPMDNGRSLRGEDVMTVGFRSQPYPALEGLQVQPRSLALFRAEQMIDLSGAITINAGEGPPRLVNGSELHLHDATLVEGYGLKERKITFLGDIAAGAEVEIQAKAGGGEPTGNGAAIDPLPFLRTLRDDYEDLPENEGEIRLVAWSPQLLGGQKIEPALDRHRGVTVVVVHLRQGATPPPDGSRYNLLAPGPRWVPRKLRYAAPQSFAVARPRERNVPKQGRVGSGKAKRQRGATTVPAYAPVPKAEPARP